MIDQYKKRKPMSAKRKKLKKTHYRDPSGVDEESLAGKMRRRNKKTQDQLDQLD